MWADSINVAHAHQVQCGFVSLNAWWFSWHRGSPLLQTISPPLHCLLHSRLWPVQANGFGDLLKRAQAQATAIEENRQRVSGIPAWEASVAACSRCAFPGFRF